MDTKDLYRLYLRQGTGGFAVIRKFHSRYSDILVRTGMLSVDDVVHEVFLSLSQSDLSNVKDRERYLLRAIKLHCWSLLDKAIRQKKMEVIENPVDGKNEEREGQFQTVSVSDRAVTDLEGSDLIAQINRFKLRLNSQEVSLLNFLIDESGRSEMANTLGMNLNTLDTKIRRLRLKLAGFLKELGYYQSGLDRFT